MKEGEILINAPHDKEFVFHDGTRARNLLDLVSKLEGISDHDFHHFVNVHKNDFANWTDHVLSDKHFAEELRTVTSRHDTIRLIKEKINDITIGHSIIQIPRIEDHTENSHSKEVMQHQAEIHSEVYLEHERLHEKEKLQQLHEKEHNLGHEIEEKEKKHAEKYLESERNVEPEKNIGTRFEKNIKNENFEENEYSEEKKEKHHEKSERLKAAHNWFKLFSKKDLSENRIKTIEAEEENKLLVENSIRDDLAQNDRENALWITLYFALVLLIITLLIYKLFL